MSQELITGLITGASITALIFVVMVKLATRDKYCREDYRLYCFECEIDMPVKRNLATGTLSCANCGLIHQNQ